MNSFNDYYQIKKEEPPQYTLEAIKDFFSKDPYKFVWTNKADETPKEFPSKSRIVLASRKIDTRAAQAMIYPERMADKAYVPIASINITLQNYTYSDREKRRDVIFVPYVFFNGVQYLTHMINEMKNHPMKGGSVYIKNYITDINSGKMKMFNVYPVPRTAIATPFEFHLLQNTRKDEIHDPMIIGDFILAGWKYHPGLPQNLLDGYNILNEYQKTTGDKVERMIQTAWNTDFMYKGDLVKVREYIEKPMDKIESKDWGWLV